MRLDKNYKYLLNNVFLFAISSFSTKIMSYIILPLYTSKVSEAEYGIIDLVNVIVNLLVPILSISISDWLLRYVTEDERQATEKFSIACLVLVLSTGGLIVLSPLISHISIVSDCTEYIIIGYFLSTANLIFSYMVRATNKVRLISVCSLLSSIITVALNILWMKIGTLSIDSYFVCQYVGISIALLIFFIRGKLYKYIKREKITKKIQKEILGYCLPLIPNSLFWWVNSSIDKISIISILSVSASGAYSAASKIPSLLTIFATIFQQAWNLSVFKKRDSEQRKFEEKTMLLYQLLLVIGAVLIIAFSKVLASILLRGEFYSSWTLVPMLVVAFVFTTVSTFIGSLFTAEKNTKPLFSSSLIAAVINIVCNIVLIYTIGLYGAAIATMISAFSNYLYRLWLVKKYKYVNKTYVLLFIPLYILLIILALSYEYFRIGLAQMGIIALIIIIIFVFALLRRRKHE